MGLQLRTKKGWREMFNGGMLEFPHREKTVVPAPSVPAFRPRISIQREADPYADGGIVPTLSQKTRKDGAPAVGDGSGVRRLGHPPLVSDVKRFDYEVSSSCGLS
jgi:hypothetical protein